MSFARSCKVNVKLSNLLCLSLIVTHMIRTGPSATLAFSCSLSSVVHSMAEVWLGSKGSRDPGSWLGRRLASLGCRLGEAYRSGGPGLEWVSKLSQVSGHASTVSQ